MSQVPNGERVRQAREIRAITQGELASACGVDQSYVSWIESGAREPSEDVLEKIAMATGFPPSFFRRESGPEFPLGSLLFRRRASLTSQDRDRFRQIARLAFEMLESMSSQFKSLDMRVPRISDRDPVEAARLTRAALGLSPDMPITHLINRLERNGVFVLALPLKMQKADAFSVWADTEPKRPIISLTCGWPGDRQRFSVAHELGHLVLHQAIMGSSSILDNEADQFASEFLLPEEVMQRELQSPLTLTRLAELKSKWGVSIQALARRGESLQIITEGQRKYLDKQLVWKGWMKDEPVRIEPEKPRLLRKMAESLYGVPPDPARVALHANAPVKFAQEVLDTHASKADVMVVGPRKTEQSEAPPRNEKVVEFRSRAKRA